MVIKIIFMDSSDVSGSPFGTSASTLLGRNRALFTENARTSRDVINRGNQTGTFHIVSGPLWWTEPNRSGSGSQ